MAIELLAKTLTTPNPQVGTSGDTESTLMEIKNYMVLNSLLLAAILEDLDKLADNH